METRAELGLDVTVGGDGAPAEPLDWPSGLKPRAQALRAVMTHADEPLTIEQVAQHFHRARRSDVRELLETLAALGQVTDRNRRLRLWWWRVPRFARMTLCRSPQRPPSRAMQSNSDKDPIEVSLGKRGGEPVFRGTRIPISYLAQYLNHGHSVEDFIEQYDIDPELVREVYRQKFSDEDERGREVPA